MSSNARKAERRREHEEAYVRECAEREAREAAARARFGELHARLEELGLDPRLLAEYVAYLDRREG